MWTLLAADRVVSHDVGKLMAENFFEARRIVPQGNRERYRSRREVGPGPALRQACRESHRDRDAQGRARPEFCVSRDRFLQSTAELRVAGLSDGRTCARCRHSVRRFAQRLNSPALRGFIAQRAVE